MRSGTVTENVEPLPGSLSKPTVPPSNSASCLLSDRPRPVPRRRFWIGESTCAKSLKDRRLEVLRDADAGVGDGEGDRFVAGSALPTRAPRPRRVNFSALEMKLRRICDSFRSSVYSRDRALRLLEDQRHVRVGRAPA